MFMIPSQINTIDVGETQKKHINPKVPKEALGTNILTTM